MSMTKLNRREFLKSGLTVGGGLGLGFSVGSLLAAGAPATKADGNAGFEANAFVHIGQDNRVTIAVKHIEFGQGTFTGLPSVLADELDCAWDQVVVRGADADPSRYMNLNWGQVQGTGGSSSMNNSFTQLRRAGATARAMLVNAAAERWQVKPGEVSVEQGLVQHRQSGQSASFGELALLASEQAIPKNVRLKTPDQFIYIGRDQPRTDQAEKVHGEAVYTQDIMLPGMRTAVVLHPPLFGATVKTIDASAALAVRGVDKVISIPSGVAVVANNFWAASKGRDALKIDWDESTAFTLSSDDIRAQFEQLSRRPGMVAREDGDVENALASAAEQVDVQFEFPFLAHASMEPMNCVAMVTDEQCELWYGAQGISRDLRNVAAALGIPTDNVHINMLYAGGSFGRRSDLASDYVVEAARIAQAMADGLPVKLVWTREDDTRGGSYRPMNLHRMRGGIDADGNIVAWTHRIIGQSILASGQGEAASQAKIDRTGIEGAHNMPYPVANLLVDVHQPYLPIPVLWWRSVGHTHTAFSTECFLDELAHASGRDPYALRRKLLSEEPKGLAVLERAAAASNWGEPLPDGHGRGMAVHYSFKTWVAEVAEIAVEDDGSFKVKRVVVAVDCGRAVNPDIIRAQMEGGVGYALSTVLGSAITLDKGRVVEGNFDRYEVLRLSQMPLVDVHIMPSEENPTGVGEPAVPPLAPAVANALFAVTGKRFRQLPIGPTV